MLDTAGVVAADLATVTAVHPRPVTAEPTEPACSVCEVALVRASGVPPAVLDGLCVPRTSAALIDLAAAEQVLATLSDRVEEALFALVPQLDDDPHLRRRVLTLKRNVHNRRSPGIATATCDDMNAGLPPATPHTCTPGWCMRPSATEPKASLTRNSRLSWPGPPG